MVAKTTIAVRRNTAVLAQSLVECPVMAMLRDEVPEGSMMFSFDPSIPANEAMVFAADGNATREWTQHVEHPFNLVNWICKKVMVQSDGSNEALPAVRVVLLDDNGDSLAFVSTGIAASLDLVRTLRGDGPYSPHIPVLIEFIKTRRGFQTLKLRPVYPTLKEVKTK